MSRPTCLSIFLKFSPTHNDVLGYKTQSTFPKDSKSILNVADDALLQFKILRALKFKYAVAFILFDFNLCNKEFSLHVTDVHLFSPFL